MGAFFKVHPAIQDVEIEVDDPAHPSTKDLPRIWNRNEEPYDFVANPRGNVHVLASFDANSYDGDTMGADHPISWCQNYDGGRSWYTGLGHNPSAYSEPLFLKHLLGGIEWAAGAVAGDCGPTDEERFEKVLLDGDTDDPLDIDIANDGRVFYVQRGGAVKFYDPEHQHTHEIAKLEVLVQHTHGVHGITLDPKFDENNFLYIYYSPLNDDVSKVSRFTFDPAKETLDLTSEKVLLEINSQRQVNAHEGGGMDFDAQGNLYVATGDNSLPCCSGFGATDERAGHENEDAQRSSANTNDLRGKILRIHPEADGTYTVPEGNLFAPGTEKTRPEIYVMGLRNPYRIHVDPETGFLHWGEVGPDARTDSATRGPKGYDEFNVAKQAGNFGWPHCIGYNLGYIDYDYATGESKQPYDCAGGPVNDSPNNTGLTKLPPVQPAWIAYPYDTPGDWPELGSGGRLALQGPTYHFDPDLQSETKFPEYYDDTDLIAEWTRNTIFEVKTDPDAKPRSMNRLWPHGTFLRPIDMEFGPDGSLYLVEWGSNYGGSGRGDPNFDSGIYKINYVRPGERSPVAKATATPTSGQPPLTVTFSSEGSADPDEGQTITYAWDFDGDGTTDSTEQNPTHEYTERGDINARLTVTDPTGRTGVRNLPVTVGNTAPVVSLNGPLDGQVFTLGEPVPYSLRVTDAEDGDSAQGQIDCTKVVTQPALGHDQHGHPLDLYSGCQGTIKTIVDSGHDHNDNIFYIVDTKYTDEGAEGVKQLTGGDSAILQPRLKQAEFFSTNKGVVVHNTDEPDNGRMIGTIDHGDNVSFEPVNLKGVTELRFRVASAGKGGRIEVRTGSATGPLLATAQVEPTGGWRTFHEIAVPVTDPGGSHELFLVFANTAGDTSLFNVDWVRFSSPLVEPLGGAYAGVSELKAAIEANQAKLTAPQKQYLTDLSTRIERELLAAWSADPAGAAFRRSAEKSLQFADEGLLWLAAQRSLDPAVKAALQAPLEKVELKTSETVTKLRKVSRDYHRYPSIGGGRQHRPGQHHAAQRRHRQGRARRAHARRTAGLDRDGEESGLHPHAGAGGELHHPVGRHRAGHREARADRADRHRDVPEHRAVAGSGAEHAHAGGEAGGRGGRPRRTGPRVRREGDGGEGHRGQQPDHAGRGDGGGRGAVRVDQYAGPGDRAGRRLSGRRRAGHRTQGSTHQGQPHAGDADCPGDRDRGDGGRRADRQHLPGAGGGRRGARAGQRFGDEPAAGRVPAAVAGGRLGRREGVRLGRHRGGLPGPGRAGRPAPRLHPVQGPEGAASADPGRGARGVAAAR